MKPLQIVADLFFAFFFQITQMQAQGRHRNADFPKRYG
jgi:hypothetical protein